MPDYADDEDPWQQVFFVSGVYDGPREGLALFRGRPHVFRSEFYDPAVHFGTDVFQLMEITPELLDLAVERHGLWERWIRTAPRSDGPVRPEDLQRNEELDRLIGDRLEVVPDRSIRAHAAFRDDAGYLLPNGLVRWLEVGDALAAFPPIAGMKIQGARLPNETQWAMIPALLGLVENALRQLDAEALVAEALDANRRAFNVRRDAVWYDGLSDAGWRRALATDHETIGMWHRAVQAFAAGGAAADLVPALRLVVDRLNAVVPSE